MPTNFSGQLYQFDSIPVPLSAGHIPLLSPRRDVSTGTTTQEYGKVYWVGKGGNDSNDGESWDTRKLTIESARSLAAGDIDTGWSVSPWAPSATIIIAPGVYAENLTGGWYGINVIGLGDAFDLNGERGVTIKPATGSAYDATSVINSRIQNLCFAATAGTSALFQADNFNRNIVEGCVFAGIPGASPTTTKGIEITTDMTGNIIRNCYFLACRNGIHITTVAPKQASGNLIEGCWITGGDQTGIYFDQNCVPSYTTIRHCTIAGGGATLALGLDDNTGVVDVSWTTFSATACDPASADSDSKYNGCYLNGSLMS